VVLSFSTFRERADFEPGGIVGMCKLFPHIMVRASVELQSVRASIRLDRPAKTKQFDSGNSDVAPGCCERDSYEEIGSILVTDSNEDPAGYNDMQKPFWSGVFSHYEVDPEKRLGGQRLRVVDTAKPSKRTIEKCGSRKLAFWPSPITDIEKMPRQGEFDNFHLAPRLKLRDVGVFVSSVEGTLGFRELDSAKWKLDPIVMAPFCSYDCFHFHWRWSVNDTEKWVLGWGEAGPHSTPGVPMVAPNQDVDVVIHGPGSFTYSAHAQRHAGTQSAAPSNIKALEWTVVMHHGGAYASAVADFRLSKSGALKAVLAIMNTMPLSLNVISVFYRRVPNGSQIIDPLTTPALLYWLMRYYVYDCKEHGLELGEWLKISTEDVDRARLG
jgi:hypothetical protein